MRDAESALDQLISFCGDQIAESDVLSMFGLTARAQILTLSSSHSRGQNRNRPPRVAPALASTARTWAVCWLDLLDHFRNLLIYRFSQGDLSLLEISENETESLATQAPMARPEVLTRMHGGPDRVRASPA